MNSTRIIARSLALALAATGFARSQSHAALEPPSVHVVRSVDNPTAYSIFLAGNSLNSDFNVISFAVTPDAPGLFTNVDTFGGESPVRPPGLPITYRNRLLDTDPADNPAGLGYVMLGTLVSSTKVEFTTGPLGQQISTATQPDGRLFLANINLPTGTARGNILLIDVGNIAADLRFVIPEPAGMNLAAIGACVGLARIRRRVGRRLQHNA